MTQIAVVVLWLLVVVSGVLLGGSIFERVAVTPLWASAPPESVTAWPYGAIQKRFFKVVTPLWGMLSLATFGLSWAMPEVLRSWARISGVIGVGVVIWTVVYFLPIVDKTEANRGEGLTPDEITRLTRAFVTWGHVRTALVLVGWLATLRAFTLLA